MSIGEFFSDAFGESFVPSDWTLLETKKEIKSVISQMDACTMRTTQRLAEIVRNPFEPKDYKRNNRDFLIKRIMELADKYLRNAFVEVMREEFGRPLNPHSEEDKLFVNEFVLREGDRVCRVASSIAVFTLRKGKHPFLKKAAVIGIAALIGGFFPW